MRTPATTSAMSMSLSDSQSERLKLLEHAV